MESKRDIGPDFLRALAILLVMVWHLPKAMLPPFLLSVRELGWLGVDIFFVLSGYLIGTELLKQVRAGRAPDLPVFYIKRAFRILPVFWLILAIYVLFPDWREKPDIASVWRYLTFTVNFGLDYRLINAFSHAWSLCVEEHFYLFLPLILLLLRRSRSAWPTICLTLAILIGGMVLRYLTWQAWHISVEPHAAIMLRDIYYPTHMRLDGLMMGVLLAVVRLFRPEFWGKWMRPALALPLGAVCLALTGYMALHDGITLSALGAVIFYPVFSLGVTLVLAGMIKIETSLTPLRWTGAGFVAAISYSLYLSHKLVMHADRSLLPNAWLQGWQGVGIYYATSICIAVLLYYAVERTFLILRKPVLARLRTEF